MIPIYFTLYLALLVAALVAVNAVCNIVTIVRMWNDPNLLEQGYEWLEQFHDARNRYLRMNIFIGSFATVLSVILYLVVTL